MNAMLKPIGRTDDEPTPDDRYTTFLESQRGSDFIGAHLDMDVPWLQEALAYGLLSNDWLYVGNQVKKHMAAAVASEAKGEV